MARELLTFKKLNLKIIRAYHLADPKVTQQLGIKV